MEEVALRQSVAAAHESPQGSTEVWNLLHRGDFRPGAALPSPALPPDPCSELLAARSSCLAGGVPGRLRTVRGRPETTDNDRPKLFYNKGLDFTLPR